MNKQYLWLINGCLECHGPIITDACPPKRSHKSLQPKLIPIPRRDSEMSNCETVHSLESSSLEICWQRYLTDFHFPDLVFIRISFGLFFQVLSLSRLCYLGASKTEQKCILLLSKWLNDEYRSTKRDKPFFAILGREVKHHIYVKRQTRICTTWPSLSFTCRLLFIISTHTLVVSRNFLCIRTVWVVFICSFSILRNSQLESSVCRLPYTWSLNLNEGL